MKTENLALCCAVLALGLATEGWAQPTLQESALSGQERQELRDLLRRFDPERPNPETLPLIQQRWLLNQLRELVTVDMVVVETETLTVCEVIGDPHLELGDKVHLRRLGASGNVMMEVVRQEGTPTQSNPWTNPGGGNTIVLNPSITHKPLPGSSNKKFMPEAAGQARVDPHTGGTPTNHNFSMRRNTLLPGSTCTSPYPMWITVPEQHTSGGRHGGHVVMD